MDGIQLNEEQQLEYRRKFDTLISKFHSSGDDITPLLFLLKLLLYTEDWETGRELIKEWEDRKIEAIDSDLLDLYNRYKIYYIK